MANKKQKKRPKKKPAIAAKQAMKAKMDRFAEGKPSTPNARVIGQMMATQNIRGNYKDYVVIAGKRLVDWQGSYDLVTEEGKTVGVNGMALVHKSKLANIVGEQLARHFWRPGIGRVNNGPGGKHAPEQG